MVSAPSLSATIVICAHNEEQNIEVCLRAVLAQTLPSSQIIVVLDRCTDKTEDIVRRVLAKFNLVLIDKTLPKWKNSISENLELARERASGDALVVVDADIVVPPYFLEKLLPQL